MKRMTRVINEDRKTGRPRFRFRFQRSSVVGDVRLWKNLWCVTRRERERGGEQLVASSHVSSRTGEISNYRGNLFFSLPFSEYAIGKRHAFSRRSTSLAKQRLSNRHSIRY